MKFIFVHKVFSITLSLLVLFSTFSLLIEKHFCGGVLIDISVFSQTEKCADDTAFIDQTDTVKKSCCKDEVVVLEGLNELTINSFDDLETIEKHILRAFSFSYINLFEGLPEAVIPHRNYSSPQLITDIQVLDETYLI